MLNGFLQTDLSASQQPIRGRCGRAEGHLRGSCVLTGSQPCARTCTWARRRHDVGCAVGARPGGQQQSSHDVDMEQDVPGLVRPEQQQQQQQRSSSSSSVPSWSLVGAAGAAANSMEFAQQAEAEALAAKRKRLPTYGIKKQDGPTDWNMLADAAADIARFRGQQQAQAAAGSRLSATADDGRSAATWSTNPTSSSSTTSELGRLQRRWARQLRDLPGWLAYRYYCWRTDTSSDLLLVTALSLTLLGAAAVTKHTLINPAYLTGSSGQQPPAAATAAAPAAQLQPALLLSAAAPPTLDAGSSPDTAGAASPAQQQQQQQDFEAYSASLWSDVYSVMLLAFGESFPSAAQAGPLEEVFSVLVALAGLAGFALALAIVEQIVLEANLANVSRGSRVYESGHYLVLGWATAARDLELIIKLVGQLCASAQCEGGATIVVLTERSKLDMEELFRRAIPAPARYGSRLVFRQGSPLLPSDLSNVAASNARATIIVADQSRSRDESDAQSLRCAILLDELDDYRGLRKGRALGHIVVETRTANAVPLLRYSCSKRVMALPTAQLNARRLASLLKRPFVSWVTQRLWDFAGRASIFYLPVGKLEGRSFQHVPFLFPDAIVMGVANTFSGTMRLNPPLTYRLQQGDELVLCRPPSIPASEYGHLPSLLSITELEVLGQQQLAAQQEAAAAAHDRFGRVMYPLRHLLWRQVAEAAQQLAQAGGTMGGPAASTPQLPLLQKTLQALPLPPPRMQHSRRAGRNGIVTESDASRDAALSMGDSSPDSSLDSRASTPAAAGPANSSSSTQQAFGSRGVGPRQGVDSPPKSSLAILTADDEAEESLGALPPPGSDGSRQGARITSPYNPANGSSTDSDEDVSMPAQQQAAASAAAAFAAAAASGFGADGPASSQRQQQLQQQQQSFSLSSADQQQRSTARGRVLESTIESIDCLPGFGATDSSLSPDTGSYSSSDGNGNISVSSRNGSNGSLAAVPPAGPSGMSAATAALATAVASADSTASSEPSLDTPPLSSTFNYVPKEYLQYDSSPQAVLVAGWCEPGFMAELLCELDNGSSALPPGSELLFVNTHTATESLGALLRGRTLHNCRVSHVQADPLQRAQLAALPLARFRAAIILADERWSAEADESSGGAGRDDEMNQPDVLRQDALMVMVQLNIRKLIDDLNLPPINIICQKSANAGLTRFEDRRRLPLGISLNFASNAAKILTQVAVSPLALMTLIHLGGDVDLTIVDASEYCTRGEAISFWRVLSRAQAAGDTLMGYYILPRHIEQPIESTVNPAGLAVRSKQRVWNTGDGRLKFIIMRDKEAEAAAEG